MQILDKYHIPQKDNIWIAKRLLVDSIYRSANLEGIAVTFADTEDILNDVNVANVKPSDITKVFSLRDGWEYIFNNISLPVDLGLLETVHTLVAKRDVSYRDLGVIRTETVRIGGTNWIPEIPNVNELHKELMEINKITPVTDRAITTLLWIMRKQPFKDGNKRVATLIANKILIENGNGIFSVPVELDREFKRLLVNYYETGIDDEIKTFINDYCLESTYNSEIEKDNQRTIK